MPHRQYFEETPHLSFSLDLFKSLISDYNKHRVISVIGPLHSGKSMFTNIFAKSAFYRSDSFKGPKEFSKWTDRRTDEHERLISLKSSPITIPVSFSDSPLLLSIIDTPGHVDFFDEVQCSLLLSDGAIVLIDAAEGVTESAQRCVEYCAKKQIPMILCLSKIDRLFIDLRLDPGQVLDKFNFIIHQLNETISFLNEEEEYFNLELNVLFCSTEYEFCFFIPDILKGVEFCSDDVILSHIIEPLSKLIVHTLVLEPQQLRKFLKTTCRLKISAEQSNFNPPRLLNVVLSKYFGNNFCAQISSFVFKLFPSLCTSLDSRLKFLSENLKLKEHFNQSADELLIIFSKIIPNPDGLNFHLIGRVLSGSIEVNDSITLVEQSSIYQPSDQKSTTINQISIHQSRFLIDVESAQKGSLIAITLSTDILSKPLALGYSRQISSLISEILPLNICKFLNEPVVRLPIEPLQSSEFPQLISSLKLIQKYYPCSLITVSESGEYSLSGSGELYLDSLMKDLREFFGNIEVKVADPSIVVRETCIEQSSLECAAKSANGANTLAFTCIPLDQKSREVLNSSDTKSMDLTIKRLEECGWDALSLSNLMSFGPLNSSDRSNCLIDESMVTMSGQYVPIPNDVKSSIVKGFDWAVREGPLTHEPVVNCSFRITHSSFGEAPLSRSPIHIIPLARRACHGALLTASPRLMEPYYKCEFISTQDGLRAVQRVLEQRRGHLLASAPQPGTRLTIVLAMVPVIDSFGLETDVRLHSKGQVMVQSFFSSFELMDGDVLDNSIELPAMEMLSEQYLAREIMVKSRRRKGLTDDVMISSFFDADVLQSL
ncbi:hypothetical protein RCL1_005880 [Eukaryota sp. TZLM3-RCL]